MPLVGLMKKEEALKKRRKIKHIDYNNLQKHIQYTDVVSKSKRHAVHDSQF